ncbi:uncharacterized protein SCHCODRAFT_02643530 [Schizophyllum commune H4-8]|uniref:Expressed protein n=1 Tax=Schizophyllum commune (strain H4-8 / FGSC 9210) TaxID=578458 RepID=D8QIY4_SCHCM|nr:uncharacterized protein SCHCODRAFT_02643530 [Schizophyllum commune H4-8]KAI5886216.1 hypothetical protein SCHCODRAFT_02643530 [Schizophyllum commune H4-8]
MKLVALSALLPFLLYTPALAAPAESVTDALPATVTDALPATVTDALPATVAPTTTASAPDAYETCDNASNCYGAVHGWGSFIDYEPYQANLMGACTNDTSVTDGAGNLWGSKACVAVAVSYQKIWPQQVHGMATCGHQQIACEADQPSLDYNIYASIVGDCAWQPNGCPITQQNFIDFVYSTLTEIGSADWPSDVNKLISEGWQPLLDWAQTGDSIPYTNFNDFLHYA